jgi:hypothetical protein
MRLSLATAACVISVALLAGCSTSSQGTTALPGSSSTSAFRGAPVLHGVYVIPGHVQPMVRPAWLPKRGERISPMKMLELQAAGKMAGPNPLKVLKHRLAFLRNHPGRPLIHIDKKKKKKGLGLWTSLTDYDYLLGQTAAGTSTVSAIDTESQTNSECYDPITVNVDHSQNIWTACQYLYNGSEEFGGVQEYSSSGNLEGSYEQGCPAPVSDCEYFYGYSFSSASNSSYTFSACTYCEYEYDSTELYGGAYEFWPTGSPSSTPTLVFFPYGSPIYDVYYIGLDSSGDLWLDYYGEYGYGVGEVTNPTTSPTFTTVPASLEFPGGVYGAGNGKLTVLDQDTRDILSCTPSSCGSYLGPAGILGDPVSGGFSSGDAKYAAGDCDDWNDIGTVSSNKWTIGKAPYDISCLEGAAYTPSDQ